MLRLPDIAWVAPPGLAGLAAAPFGSAPCGGRGGQWRRACGRPGGAQGATAAVLRHQRGDAEDGQEELGGPGAWGYLEDTKGWCNVSLGYLYRFIHTYACTYIDSTVCFWVIHGWSRKQKRVFKPNAASYLDFVPKVEMVGSGVG